MAVNSRTCFDGFSIGAFWWYCCLCCVYVFFCCLFAFVSCVFFFGCFSSTEMMTMFLALLENSRYSRSTRCTHTVDSGMLCVECEYSSAQVLACFEFGCSSTSVSVFSIKLPIFIRSLHEHQYNLCWYVQYTLMLSRVFRNSSHFVSQWNDFENCHPL